MPFLFLFYGIHFDRNKFTNDFSRSQVTIIIIFFFFLLVPFTILSLVYDKVGDVRFVKILTFSHLI